MNANVVLSVRWAVACLLLAILPEARGQQVLVSNFGASTLTRYDLGTRALLATHGGGSGLVNPLAARIGPDGKLYVTSEGSNAILRFDPSSGAFIDTFVTSGSGGLTQPTGLDWGRDGNLYVASFDGNRVLRYNGSTGAFMGVFVASGSGGLNGADNGTIFGPDGNLYVPSYNTGRVLKYNGTTGAFMSTFAFEGQPRVIIFRQSDVLISSEVNGIRRHSLSNGSLLSTLVAIGSGTLSTPIGMALAPDGTLLVASSGNNKILRYNGTTGAFTQTFAQGAPNVSLPAYITIVPGPGAGVVMLLGSAGLVRRRRC